MDRDVSRRARRGEIVDGAERARRREKRDRLVDGAIRALKTMGRNNLLFGAFLILEGMSLMFFSQFFAIFVVLSILIAYAFAIEWLVKVLRGEKTLWNKIQRGVIVVILVGLLVFCGFMIFSAEFRTRVDLILVSTTTAADGLNNLYHSLKIEDNLRMRHILVGFCTACVIYGVVYGLTAAHAPEFFTETIHGIVIIFCGFTNIWLGMRAKRVIGEYNFKEL